MEVTYAVLHFFFDVVFLVVRKREIRNNLNHFLFKKKLKRELPIIYTRIVGMNEFIILKAKKTLMVIRLETSTNNENPAIIMMSETTTGD